MEQEKITIRKMNIEDIPAVFEIEQSIFSIPWSEKSLEKRLIYQMLQSLLNTEESILPRICLTISLIGHKIKK